MQYVSSNVKANDLRNLCMYCQRAMNVARCLQHSNTSCSDTSATITIVTTGIESQHANLHKLGEGLLHHLLISQSIRTQSQVERSLWVWLSIQHSNHGLHGVLQDTSGIMGLHTCKATEAARVQRKEMISLRCKASQQDLRYPEAAWGCVYKRKSAHIQQLEALQSKQSQQQKHG